MDTEKSVGTILREARIQKGLTLLDVEKGTSIRSRYLEAVEKDEYDKTPGEVFLKGIIRNYGNFVGLDGLALVNAYKASAAGLSAEAVRAAEIREVEKVKLNIQLKNPRDLGSGNGSVELPWRQIAVGVLAVVVLAAGYFAVPRAIAYFQARPQKQQETRVAEAKPESVSAGSAKQTQTGGVAAAAAPLTKVALEMEAVGDCWLEVNADGAEVFSGMLHEKDKKSFEAKDKLIVKYGNIGVMKVVVNGESVDLQGEHGVAVKTYALNTEPAKQAEQPAQREQ